MGKQAAFGPFTPIVVATRQVVGEKRFNQIRGKVNFNQYHRLGAGVSQCLRKFCAVCVWLCGKRSLLSFLDVSLRQLARGWGRTHWSSKFDRIRMPSARDHLETGTVLNGRSASETDHALFCRVSLCIPRLSRNSACTPASPSRCAR